MNRKGRFFHYIKDNNIAETLLLQDKEYILIDDTSAWVVVTDNLYLLKKG